MNTLLVDDHALFRAGIRLLLGTIRDDATIFEAATIGEALLIAEQHSDLQLCLLDLGLKAEFGLNAIEKLRAVAPNLAVVVISGIEEPSTIVACIEAGAMSFIPKSAPPEVLTHALRRVLAGEVFLPDQLIDDSRSGARPKPMLAPRQLDVMRALSRGLPTKLIARELNLSEHTVREYATTIYRILGVRNRTEAVIKVGRLGILLSSASS